MRSISPILALAFQSALCLPVVAGPVDTLKTALDKIPETVLSNGDPMPVVFLDVKAMSKAESGALSDAALKRMILARGMRPLESLNYGGGKTWTENAGIAYEDISYFAAYGMPPMRVTYWGLKNAAAASDLVDWLKGRTFREVSASPRILANGDPRAISLLNRQPDNPWLGPLGQTSAVMTLQEAVIQSSAADDFQPIITMKRSAADNDAMATALDAIASTPALDDAAIVQAAAITPLFGLTAADPAASLAGKPVDAAAVKQAIDAQMQSSRQGIPPYSGGLIADMQQGNVSSLVISLAYPDCVTADKAVASLKSRWEDGLKAAQVARISGQSVKTKNGACAALVAFTDNGDSPRALGNALNHYTLRDFNILQIGAPG